MTRAAIYARESPDQLRPNLATWTPAARPAAFGLSVRFPCGKTQWSAATALPLAAVELRMELTFAAWLHRRPLACRCFSRLLRIADGECGDVRSLSPSTNEDAGVHVPLSPSLYQSQVARP